MKVIKIKIFFIITILNIINILLRQIYKCEDCKHSEYCKMEKGKICKVFVPNYINLED